MDRILEWTLFLLAAGFALLGFGLQESPSEDFSPGPRDPQHLRVVTWNVGGSAQGGRPLSEEFFPAVADTLRRLDPDLVFLQEVRDLAQLQQLAERIGQGWHLRISQAGDRRVAAMARRGSLRARPWPGDSRTLTVLYQPREKPPIVAVALHADAFSSRRRNRSVGRAVDLLSNAPSRLARLLAGDLNLDIDLDKRRDLFSDNEHLDVETYNYAAGRLNDAGSGAGSTAEPDRRLDYIFVDRERLQVVEAGPWKGRRSGDMDHDPVVADLLFKEPN